jgi:asparagine N-glycosylation enzyme membrane subunit Stt3
MAVKEDGSDSPPEDKGKLSLSRISGTFSRKEKEIPTESKGRSEGPTKAKEGVPSNRLSTMLKGSWFAKNWQTTLVLIMILGLAFFIRVYFAYPLSVDNGFLVSGGSDSYYHMRVIDHVVSTGQHLVFDDMLNYPNGMRNARPPLYDWSVAVTGMGLNSVFGIPQDDAVGYSLVFSTAFWGMMTIIPVFLIANAAFGRKAGLIAAFFFALMPGHIERSVFSNADHDAIVLFFVVFSFYFFLRALQTIKGTRWISKWTDVKAIRSGGKVFLDSNALSIVYAALAGVCISAVAMIWTGFTYLLIIALVYLVVQLLVDRFRNADSTGIVTCFTVMWGVAFALMAPVYYLMNYWQVWFDVPFYLFLIGVGAGVIFIVTRDLPWTLVLPAIAVTAIVGLFALSFVAPELFNAVVSGQGYLVKSKLYATISEAQPPSISNFIMSFGAVTFWLALAGLAYAVIKIPKTTGPYLVFLVVWGATSIYMASSAGRFLFNAAPVFAVLGGWVMAMIIDRVNFQGYFHDLASTISNPKAFLRKLVSFQVVLVVVLVAITVMLPNVWTAFDASIPSEDKREYDLQIYNVMPDFLHPQDFDYDQINGSYWYLGGFSYSMPLPKTYWPTAWRWYSEQDANLTEEERPAFLSWWDYGFEAVQKGQHPTVADNFQNAYQYAGTFITAQNETQSIAMFILRNSEKMIADQDKGTVNYDAFWASMEAAGVNMTWFFDVMNNPADYSDFVLDHPEIFGPYDQDISPANTKYAMGSYVLSFVGQEKLVALYHQQRDVTGYDIGYFAIDGRLFPFTATSYNIFYAPATLADRRVDTGNVPIDFYEIKAVDQYGNEYALGDVPSGTTIVDYSITYKDMFYNCMLYRAFMGYGPEDIGKTTQGIPGVSGSLASLPSMQAWNMTHYRAVYRTAYFNPYNENETAFHADEWRAISYDEALVLQEKINNGTMNGTVDASTVALSQGVVFIQYYDGVIIRGRAVTQNDEPMEGIWVTVQDEYGTPHNTVKTDADGNYEVIAPFGNVSLKFSFGSLDLRTQVGTLITTKFFNFTYEQAMRRTSVTASSYGAAAESNPDWIVDGNITIQGGNIQGKVYLDVNGNGRFDAATDQLLENATVHLKDTASDFSREMVANEGEYSFTGLPPMNARIWAVYEGHEIGLKTMSIVPKMNTTVDIGVKPATVKATILTPWGTPAPNLDVDLIDLTNGNVSTSATNSAGLVTYTMLFPGQFQIRTNSSALQLNIANIAVAEGKTYVLTLTLRDAMTVQGQVIYTPTSGTVSVPYARIGFISPTFEYWTTADANGYYAVTLPRLNYSIYAISNVDGKAVVNLMTQTAVTEVNRTISLRYGEVISGFVKDNNKTVSGAKLILNNSFGGMITGITNSTGGFRFVLPNEEYTVYAAKGARVAWEQVPIGKSNITLDKGYTVSGKVWLDLSYDDQLQTNEGRANVTIYVKDEASVRKLVLVSGSNGVYNVTLPINGTYTFNVDQKKYEPVSFTFNDLNANQTRNIELVPTNRSLSGQVDLNGSGLANAWIDFDATSGWGNDTKVKTDSLGNYAVSLRPGNYTLSMSQNLTANNDSSQYQLINVRTVSLSIGQDPSVLQLNATLRYKVKGTVASSGTEAFTGKISFNSQGLDSVTLSTNGSFSTYLRPGNYSVYVISDVGTDKEAYFDLVQVTGPTTLALTTDPANRITVDLRYKGVPLLSNIPVVLTDPVTGAIFNGVTNPTGSLTIYMPSGGLYNMTVDYHTLAYPYTLADQKKYLLYQAEEELFFNTTKNVVVALIQSFDNSTVNGLPIGATVELQAASSTAMSITLTTTSSTAMIAPGNYTIYATDPSDNAFLGFIMVKPRVTNDLGITLVPAYRLNGTLRVDGTPKYGNVTISQDDAAFVFDTNPLGAYEIFLPTGSYTGTGMASIQMNGIPVNYKGTVTIAVTGATQKDIDLAKDLTYGVKLSWNNTKGTVANGQPITYIIQLTNTGNMVDSYEISSSTLNWNVTFNGDSNQTQLLVENLTFGTAGFVNISVTLIPSNKVNVIHSPVFISAVSTNGTGAVTNLNLDVNIIPRNDVNLTYQKALPQNGKDNYTYSILVENVGNQDDQYKVEILNISVLRSNGWNATMRQGETGNFTEGFLIFNVTAGRNKTVQVSLIKIDPNVQTDVFVNMLATSLSHNNTEALTFNPQFTDNSIPEDGFTVSGSGVAFKMPDMSNETIGLMVACALFAALLVFLMIKKEVLVRRKR